MLETIENLIFPTKCGICNKVLNNSYLCENCKKDIEKYNYKYNNNFSDKFFILEYSDIIRQNLIKYKFNDKSYLNNMFVEIIKNNKKVRDFLKNYDIILPVPIHKKRINIRGFNQCDLIAKKIAKYFNISIDKKVITKKVDNKIQSTLGKKDREINIKNVYNVENKHNILNKSVVIFDDIYTTGATVNEIKKILLECGAKNVGILILAKD